MILDEPDMEIPRRASAAPLAAARALLRSPVEVSPSPWPALASAFVAACAALIAAASVILCGPTLGDASHTVYAPAGHRTPF